MSAASIPPHSTARAKRPTAASGRRSEFVCPLPGRFGAARRADGVDAAAFSVLVLGVRHQPMHHGPSYSDRFISQIFAR
jgi:hypothetical protein